MPSGTVVAHWPCKKGGVFLVRAFLACVCLTAFEAFQPPLPQNLALQKGRRISGARFSRGSSAFQPLRLPSLPSPKTLGAVFCAWLSHPVSARLSEAVCLGLSLCGSLPSLLGSGFPSFLPQSSLCCLPLAASPPIWRGTVSRGAPHSPQTPVGLLSRPGGISNTCLGLW